MINIAYIVLVGSQEHEEDSSDEEDDSPKRTGEVGN